jgi:hypothetical protein
MSEVSRTWDSLYNDIRAILDKIDPKRSQTFPISHALRGELLRLYRRLPPSFQNITNNSFMVGVIPSYGGAGVGVL